MKKILKSRLFYFVLGAILFSGMTVLAYSLKASDVTYTPASEEFSVDNAQSALDQLFELTQNSTPNIIDLGTAATIDVSSYEGYENFTVDNFFVTAVSFGSSVGTSGGYENGSFTKKVGKSYDPETGTFKLSNLTGSQGLGTGTLHGSITVNTY